MFLFLSTILCLIEREYDIKKRQLRRNDGDEYYFDQILDHFHPENNQTFKQRYFVQNTPYTWAPPQPIILYISGESDTFDHGQRDHLISIANDIKGRIVALEHRYFGMSYPTENITSENLRDYMNTSQVFGDIKNFREFYTSQVDINDTSKWIIVGGSYSGMLSAFSRKLYPNLFHAAISSSGVVMAYDDFPQYDMGVAIAMGPKCAEAARQTRVRIEREIEDGRLEEIERAFDMVGLTKLEFLEALSDLYSNGVQYGETHLICDPLLNAIDSGKDPLEALAYYTRSEFKYKDCGGNCTEAYSIKWLRETEGKGHGTRAWMWMVCNELGWWQTGAHFRTSVRSPQVNAAYENSTCHAIFDTDTFKINDLDVSIFNEKYHGYNQTTSRIFYATGAQDPWTWACITEDNLPKNTTSIAHTLVGPNLAHCADQRDYNDNPPPDIVRTREWQRKLVAMWLKEDDN